MSPVLRRCARSSLSLSSDPATAGPEDNATIACLALRNVIDHASVKSSVKATFVVNARRRSSHGSLGAHTLADAYRQLFIGAGFSTGATYAKTRSTSLLCRIDHRACHCPYAGLFVCGAGTEHRARGRAGWYRELRRLQSDVWCGWLFPRVAPIECFLFLQPLGRKRWE